MAKQAINMSKKVNKESRLSRILKAPVRFLVKARDFYINSMSEYSDKISYGAVMGCPTGQVNTLPRSYSVSSVKSNNCDNDLRELMRAASTRSLSNKDQSEVVRRQQAERRYPNGNLPIMPRSYSVGIGRIDEDKPCEFEEDVKVRTDLVFPRSRSYAVSKRNGVFL